MRRAVQNQWIWWLDFDYNQPPKLEQKLCTILFSVQILAIF